MSTGAPPTIADSAPTEAPWRQRRARLSVGLPAFGALVCAAMSGTAWLLGREPAAIIFLALFCASIGATLAGLLRRVSLAAHLTSLTALLATLSGLWLDGGTLGPGAMWLAVLPILYSLLLNQRSYILFTATTTVAGLALIGGELTGVLTPPRADHDGTTIVALLDLVAGLAFVNIGVGVSARAAQRAERQQQGLIEQLQIEVQARRAAEAEARAAEQARAVFLATVSHEVRTPLNVIRGLAEVLGETPISEHQRRMVEAIHSASDMVVRLLNDTLDLSKVEAGGLQLIEDTLDVVALVEQTGSALRHSPAAQHLRVTVRIDPAVGPAYLGDAVRLQQMLLNLGTNALKFTERGEVELGLRLEGEALRFSVRDTGPGLPPEVQSKLFQPFVQASASTQRTHGGTGLGLAIVRGLAGAMGGAVGVDSTVGTGSTFWFTAKLKPTAVAAPARPAPSAEAPEGADRPFLQLFDRHAEPAPAEPEAPLSVLLVEDDPSNARVVSAALSREGARVTVAEDGALAITLARNGHYDLILLDSHLPDMDGPTVARVLRALPVAGKIVALTGEAGEQARMRSVAAGMDAHLTKPISRSELGAVLRACRRPVAVAS